MSHLREPDWLSQWSKQSNMSIASGLFRTSVSHSDRVISMGQKTGLQRTFTCWEEAEERRPRVNQSERLTGLHIGLPSVGEPSGLQGGQGAFKAAEGPSRRTRGLQGGQARGLSSRRPRGLQDLDFNTVCKSRFDFTKA